METHCVNMELKYQNQALKDGQHGQILNETSNKAKINKEIEVLEKINIELEHSVAKLLADNEKLHKENEHLKQTYKDLYDSIKTTRVQTKDHNDSLIAQINSKTVENADLKAQIQEKVFANVALKNELRKLKGNSVDTKFAKPSILGKPVLQPPRNQSVVRQPNAFKSERPNFSKPRFASQVDVNNVLSKPVTQHYLPKGRESAFAKPNHMIASSSSRNSSKNMPRFSSNDMVHNYYLEEAKKKTQERDRKSTTSVMPSAKSQNTTKSCKSKPRSNNQTSRVLPTSKSSCPTTTVMPKADHSRNSSPFSDFKHFVCSICQKCVFNANHDACIIKFLKEVNSRAKIQPSKTRNSNKLVDPTSHTRRSLQDIVFLPISLPLCMRKQTLQDLTLGGYRRVEFLTLLVLSGFQLERHSHLAQQRLIVNSQMVQMIVSLTLINAIKLSMSVQEFMYDEQGQWLLITSDQHPCFMIMVSVDNTSGPAPQRKEECTLQCALSSKEEKSSCILKQKSGDYATSMGRLHFQIDTKVRRGQCDPPKKQKTGTRKHKSSELENISEADLTEAEQLKIVIKRSRQETHSSHASGSEHIKELSLKSSGSKTDIHKTTQEEEEEDDHNDDENDQEDDDARDDDKKSEDDDDEEMTESDNDGDDFCAKLGEDAKDQENKAVKDSNTNLDGRDKVLTDVEDTHDPNPGLNPDGPQHKSSSVSSDSNLNMLNPKSQISWRTYKKEVSKIIPKVEKFVNDRLESEVLVRSSKEANSSHAVAANLSELELKKILIDKMEMNNSIIRVNSFTMKMEILLEPTSNKLMVERFNTLAGNPVKKILLKLNLSDHSLRKDGGGGP
ncbi:hypothetical protein Tco_1167069 [Tanacetum coccineum]